MKKGFTLIELLAVILILGIIALIAIPVVTKLIEQANMSSFKETNQNIASAAEDACSKTNLTSTAAGTSYSFSSNGSTTKLDVKGKLPTGGAVATNSSCKSIVYTSNNKYCAVKTADEDEVTVGKIVNGNCNVVMQDNSYCTKDTNPGVLEGAGTENDPYLINSIEDLVNLKNLVGNDSYHFSSKFVKLNQNLDFKNSCSYADSNNTTYGDINGDGKVEGLMTELTTGKGYNPIEYYYGSFDGGNHTISNLYINRDDSRLGLFGAVEDEYYYPNPAVTFKNINMTNVNIIGGSYSSVGALIGYLYDSDQANYPINLLNINVSGNIVTGGSAGLVAGQIYTGATAKYNNFTTIGSVSGGNYVGGAIGYSSDEGDYEDIKNYATITSSSNYAGGVIGRTHEGSTLINLYNYGDVTTYSGSAGGILGYLPGSGSGMSTLKDLYNYGNIYGQNDSYGNYVGGVIGQADSSGVNMMNIYNYGNITTKKYSDVGGVFGYLRVYNGSEVKNIYNYGNVTNASYRTGGISGEIYGDVVGLTLNNLANYGNVIGSSYTGGITGSLSRTVLNNVLNIGNVTENGTTYSCIGGIAGSGSNITLNNAYVIGNITVNVSNSSTDTFQSYIGGAFGTTDGQINNTYIIGNITVNNASPAINGYIGGIVGYKYNDDYLLKNLNITNAYYKGNLNISLSSATKSTIFGGDNATTFLTNTYYNNSSVSNFNNINGTAVANSSVTGAWFNTDLNLGSAFNYSDGLYPKLYLNGNTVLISGQSNSKL